MFTDNNYIYNLRIEKPIKKEKEIDSDNVGDMRKFLAGGLEESVRIVDDDDDDEDDDEDDEDDEEDEDEDDDDSSA